MSPLLAVMYLQRSSLRGHPPPWCPLRPPLWGQDLHMELIWGEGKGTKARNLVLSRYCFFVILTLRLQVFHVSCSTTYSHYNTMTKYFFWKGMGGKLWETNNLIYVCLVLIFKTKEAKCPF